MIKPVDTIDFDPALTAPNAPFILDRRSRASNLRELSAGFMESVDGGKGEPWTLPYEEIILGIAGTLTLHVEGQDEPVVVAPGDFAILEKGTTVVYEATPGTRALYALTPADWLTRQPELWAQSQTHEGTTS